MYTFINIEPFLGTSALYDVYFKEKIVTTVVLGYCPLNNIYYFTEYRGNNSKCFIDVIEEFCCIFCEFIKMFDLLTFEDIVVNPQIYETHVNCAPKLTVDKLYIYDSEGQVHRNDDDDWRIIPKDNIVKDMVEANILNGNQLLLEEYESYEESDDLFVDLNTDVFCCEGDYINGFYLAINDLEKIKQIGGRWYEVWRQIQSIN